MRVTVGVGLIGCGTVGSAVAHRLIRESARLERRTGANIEFRGIAVRSPGRRADLPSELFTLDPYEIADDPRVDLVIECAGGTGMATELVERALERGAHVVTANKDLIATQGPRLLALARASQATLNYEAAVCGAVPIVRVLREALAGDEVLALAGVVNGTCTAILSAMEDGASFEAALADAQRCGYAEADPSSDILGIDAAHKLAVLMQLAFGAAVVTPMIPCQGIAEIAKRDIARARLMGCRVRLIAAARRTERGFAAGVSPQLVPEDHPFAQTCGPQNAVRIDAADAGELLLSGPGAGGAASASAILADVVHAIHAVAHPGVEKPNRMLQAPGRIEPYFPQALSIWDGSSQSGPRRSVAE